MQSPWSSQSNLFRSMHQIRLLFCLKPFPGFPLSLEDKPSPWPWLQTLFHPGLAPALFTRLALPLLQPQGLPSCCKNTANGSPLCSLRTACPFSFPGRFSHPSCSPGCPAPSHLLALNSNIKSSELSSMPTPADGPLLSTLSLLLLHPPFVLLP